MYTSKVFRHLVWGALVLGVSQAQGQVSVPGHLGGPGDHLGWNNSTFQPLEVRHDGNFRIEWYTDALHRMGLYPNVNNTINGYTVNQTGYFGLSDEPAFFTGSGPFSKIHLVEAFGSTNPVNYAQVLGFRDWMRNGVTMTGNSDQCYMGAKYNGDDNSDLVLQWSDNPDDAIYGTDRLRFLFTNRRSTTGATYGARSEEGLESFRVFIPNDTSANVGIGDFYRRSVLTSTVVDPTERLDVLDGKVRIRQLPTDPVANTLNKYLVVDDVDPSSPEYGVVKWRNIPAAATACEWVSNIPLRVVRSGDAVTGTNGTCPDRSWRYTLGEIGASTFKLDVNHDQADAALGGGIRSNFKVNNTAGLGSGMELFVVPSGVANYFGGYGLRTKVTNARYAIGVDGQVELSSASATGTDLYGVWGRVSHTAGSITEVSGVRGQLVTSGTVTTANGSYGLVYSDIGAAVGTMHGARGESRANGGSATTAYGVHGYSHTTGGTITNSYGVLGNGSHGGTTNYGVYGVAGANGSVINASIFGGYCGIGTNDWSGYFVGRTFSPGAVWTASDENLKTDIAALENATERLMQLVPKSYIFRTDEFPSMGLPHEQQYGFLAPELQEVFPEMVIETIHPASYDTSGVELTPAIPFKAVSLGGLTPVLVAAFKEQQATIADLNDRLAQMEARLDGCCSGSPSDGRSNATEEGNGNSSTFGNDRTLRIVPNPMQDQATIYYHLERSGRMQLLANSADGKELRVLKEAQMEAGNYQHDWATAGMAPGVYYVTLLLDGQPITKKVIKITP